MLKELPICLAIETSCDETSVAVTQGRNILSNIISTQIDIHRQYGGVVPEIASRHHIENINFIIQQALDEAHISFKDIDIVATTYGPGLVGALLVGVSIAKSIAFALDKPLVAVHHIEGHIAANYIENDWIQPPFICLVVSGGHTQIINIKSYTKFDIIATTRDDAAGEAFDKVARVLGLGYPGGPLIEKISKDGNQLAYNFPTTHFENSLDFSFSGVKTAVINQINRMRMIGESINVADIAASFQRNVIDVLVKNTIAATKDLGFNTIAIAGGVAASTFLTQSFKEVTEANNIRFSCPKKILCTDNAAMIGCAAYYNYLAGKTSSLDLNAIPNAVL